MSHELRTPLNAIIGFSEVLIERMFGEVNDKQLEYLQDIHSSGQHLLSLINDILDLSKIEAGRMELELTRFDLGLLLDNALTLVRERAQRHGLALALEVDAARRRLGRPTSARSSRCVINLLSNAVKFTPDGRHASTVRARRAATARSRSRSPTPASASRPTSRRWCSRSSARRAATTCARREGTGLGLALAQALRRAARRHDPGRERTGPGLDVRLHLARADARGEWS